MEETTTAPQTVVENYLEALKSRDVEKIVDFFAEDAVIHFMSGVFKGRDALEEWHKDRFEADMQIVSVKKMRTKGNKVTIDGTITSNKLKAWKIGKLAGKATFSIQDGKIQETKFSVRMYNPLAGF